MVVCVAVVQLWQRKQQRKQRQRRTKQSTNPAPFRNISASVHSPPSSFLSTHFLPTVSKGTTAEIHRTALYCVHEIAKYVGAHACDVLAAVRSKQADRTKRVARQRSEELSALSVQKRSRFPCSPHQVQHKRAETRAVFAGEFRVLANVSRCFQSAIH